MYIYIIKNIKNNKFYIGKTASSIENRWRSHLSTIKHCIKYNKKLTHLHNSILKYGRENFKIELLEAVNDKSCLSEREIFWISKMKPQYNMTSGGDGCAIQGIKRTKQFKEKMSIIKKNTTWIYNTKTLEEKQINLENFDYNNEWKIGRSPKTNHGGKLGEYNSNRSKKISIGNIGRKAPNKGIQHKELSKIKMSIRKKEFYLNGGKHPKAKKVIIENITYNSIKEASKKTGLSSFIIRKKFLFC